MVSTRYSVAIFAPATLSDAIWQSTSTPFTTRSTEITLIPFEIASFTAGATASESTGFTIRTDTFLDTRSSTSLVCLAASSPASTVISFAPFSSASACAPSARLTKNGLFNVDTDNPIAPFPTTPFSPTSAVPSPSIVMIWHPAAEDNIAHAAVRATIFFIFISKSLLYI